MTKDNLPEYDSSQLSDTQKEIVKSDEHNIIVVAGAGSGKTRVLTERIKYLINDKGVDPSNIVSITFTNMAADVLPFVDYFIAIGEVISCLTLDGCKDLFQVGVFHLNSHRLFVLGIDITTTKYCHEQ